MTDSNFSDITNWYNAVMSATSIERSRHGDSFDYGDFEVVGALNAASTALQGLMMAVDRAHARYEIAAAKRKVEAMEAVLGD